MFLTKLLLVYGFVYVLLTGCGLGLSLRLCRGAMYPYRWPLAPILGLIALALASTWVSALGVAGPWAGRCIALAAVLFSAWAAWRHAGVKEAEGAAKPAAALLVLSLITLLPSIVLLGRHGLFTSTFESYSFFVAVPADHFISLPMSQAVPLDYSRPISSLLHQITAHREYFGFFYLLATVASVTGQAPHEIYLILSAVVGMLLPVAVYVAAAEGFKISEGWSLVTALLAALNSTFLVWTFMGQLPILAGLVCLILAMACTPRLFRRPDGREIALYSLYLAGVLSLYPVLLPYAAALFGIYFFKGLVQGGWRAADFKVPIKIGLLSLAVNPFIFIFLALSAYGLAVTTSRFTTNIPRYPFLRELWGFLMPFSDAAPGAALTRLYALGVAGAVALSAAGLLGEIRRRRFDLAAPTLLVLAVGGYFLSMNFRYHVYKNAVVGLFLFFCCLSAGLCRAWEAARWRPAGKVLAGGALGLVLILNGMNFVGLAAKDWKLLDGAVTGTAEVKDRITPGALLLLDVATPTEEAWLAYFLREVRLKLKGLVEPWGFWILAPYTSEPNPAFFFNPSVDRADFLLSRKPLPRRDIVKAGYGPPVFENGGYVVTEGLPDPYLLRGWYAAEAADESPFRWTEKACSVLFRGERGRARVLDLKATVPDVYGGALGIEVCLNGASIERFSAGPGAFEERVFLPGEAVRAGENLLEMRLGKAFVPKERGDSGDARTLGIMVQRVAFQGDGGAGWSGRIDLGDPGDRRFLLGGWSHDEVVEGGGMSFVWCTGPAASLVMESAGGTNTEMRFAAHPFTIPGGPPQTLEVRLNGAAVSRISLHDDVWETYTIRLPAEDLWPGLNRIDLVFAHSAMPAEVFPGNGDRRRLAAAFDWIAFVPAASGG